MDISAQLYFDMTILKNANIEKYLREGRFGVHGAIPIARMFCPPFLL